MHLYTNRASAFGHSYQFPALRQFKIYLLQADANVEFMLLDLSSLPSIKEFADLYISWGLPLDILVCNAGVFGGSLRY